jgi:hypothetical protein
MADTVQYLMEQMIPELEDLERKGYFARSEIKKIVQKRQDFEYLLKRRAALKEDFYRYEGGGCTPTNTQACGVDTDAPLCAVSQVHRLRGEVRGASPVPQAQAGYQR